MTRDDLQALREGWAFEAKKAAGRGGRGVVPEALWESYSAMANTGGGRIVLGVKERQDGSFEVHGLLDPDRVERDLWNLLQNPQKASANVLTRGDVERHEIDGKTILVIAVPRARREERPVYVGGDVWRGTYLRVHEGDRRADRERVRRMIADATYATRDDRVRPRFTTSDLDPDTVKAYRAVLRTTRPDHPWHALGDETFLRQLGAVRRDRESGAEGLTVAGLLMFGRFAAIREALPHYFLDYQERGPDTGAIEWLDRIVWDGTWSGNVYDFYRRAITKLTANLRVPFQLGPDLYRRDETHVHEALREALVNALIHSDYEGRVSVLAVKRPDGFEFRNPGGLRLPVEQIRRGGVSDCRNRTLQQMFLMLGIGEQAGSGYSRILRAWEEQAWRVPSLIEDTELDTTTLHLGMVSLLPQDVLDELERRFSGRFQQLAEGKRLAVATALAEGRVTNRRLQEITIYHPRDLTFLLRDLVAEGFLERHGERSGAWYTLGVGVGEPRRGSQSSEMSGRISESMTDKGVADRRALSQNSASLSQSSASLSQSSASLSQSDKDTDADPTAHVRSSRWAKRGEVRRAVLHLCGEAYMTASALAAQLGRAERTMRQNYVFPMVAEGLLRLRYPDTPSHPDQAYRAASADETDA